MGIQFTGLDETTPKRAQQQLETMVSESGPFRRQLTRNENTETQPGKSQVKMKVLSLWNRKVQLAFGSAILTLLVVGAISYRGMVVSGESDRWVSHTHEVLE